MINLGISDLIKETKESIRRSARLEAKLDNFESLVKEIKLDTKEKLGDTVPKIGELQRRLDLLEARCQSIENRIETKFESLEHRMNTILQNALLKTLEKIEHQELIEIIDQSSSSNNKESS